jgi:hypothetical protein
MHRESHGNSPKGKSHRILLSSVLPQGVDIGQLTRELREHGIRVQCSTHARQHLRGKSDWSIADRRGSVYIFGRPGS